MDPSATASATFTTYVLKDGDTFIVADAAGDIEGGSDGFFHNDTRLLSRFRLRISGQARIVRWIDSRCCRPASRRT